MPTKREREYYRMGFADGQRGLQQAGMTEAISFQSEYAPIALERGYKPKPKRKLSAWNKFVRANSKKKIYQYANGKLKLKKMGIAFRKKRK